MTLDAPRAARSRSASPRRRRSSRRFAAYYGPTLKALEAAGAARAALASDLHDLALSWNRLDGAGPIAVPATTSSRSASEADMAPRPLLQRAHLHPTKEHSMHKNDIRTIPLFETVPAPAAPRWHVRPNGSPSRRGVS